MNAKAEFKEETVMALLRGYVLSTSSAIQEGERSISSRNPTALSSAITNL